MSERTLELIINAEETDITPTLSFSNTPSSQVTVSIVKLERSSLRTKTKVITLANHKHNPIDWSGSVSSWDLSEPAKDNIRSRIASTVQSASIPDNNLTKDEQRALKRLKNDESIVILPADKDE